MKVTIKDIADEAGVSISTVSYALNKKSKLKKEIHKKIRELARKNNYVPNTYARSLATGVSNNIGLVQIGPKSDERFFRPFMTNFLRELLREVNKSFGWLSTCILNEFNNEALRKFLSNAKVDGLIFMYTVLDHDIIQLLKSLGIPYVYFGLVSENSDMNGGKISCDDYIGAKMVFDHLVSTGHKKIMCVSGELYKPGMSLSDINSRCRAYIDKIDDKKLNYKVILNGKFTEEGSYEVLKKFLNSKNKELPDAIFAGTDVMAYGVIKALNESGLKVPEDVSVIGYDDANVVYNKNNGLTTVRQPIVEMIQATLDYIYKFINDGEIKPVNLEFKPKLIIRKTTIKR